MRWSIFAALLMGCAMPSWATERAEVAPRADEPVQRESSSAPPPIGPCSPPLAEVPSPPELRTTPAGPQWTRVASLNRARFGAFAHVLSDGRVLVVGGTRVESGVASVEGVEIYDSVTDHWTLESEWPASEGPVAIEMADASRVIAITHATATLESRTRIYDVARGSWFVGASPPYRYSSASSLTRLRNGELLLVGGSGAGTTTSAARYDPTRNEWRRAAYMQTGRDAHRAMLLDDGRVLVIGGVIAADRPIGEIYDPERDAWTAIAAARLEPGSYAWDLVSAWVDHGRVLVPGRAYYSSTARQPVAILDVACDRWEDVLYLPLAFEFYQPVALGNAGTALIGGAPRGSWSDAERVYTPLIDVSTKSVRLLQPLPERRDAASSVVLATGEILAFGGTQGSCGERCWYTSYADAWKLRP